MRAGYVKVGGPAILEIGQTLKAQTPTSYFYTVSVQYYTYPTYNEAYLYIL